MQDLFGAEVIGPHFDGLVSLLTLPLFDISLGMDEYTIIHRGVGAL